MTTRHPSGRPVRRRIVKTEPPKRWTRTESIVVRLDQPRRDLVGGFGFVLPRRPLEAAE